MTISDMLATAVEKGWLHLDAAKSITTTDELKALISPEQFRELLAQQPVELQSAITASIPNDEPTPLLNVPIGHEDNAFVPQSLDDPMSFVPPTTESSAKPAVKRQLDPPMSRETMWKWIGIGGGLWLLGFIVLGVWLGGCFSDPPKPKVKPKTSQTK